MSSRLLALLLLALPSVAHAEPDLFHELQWRHVGPFRGGRTKAATGVAGRPGLFFLGAVNGGVFRSDDYGRTWVPLFDGQASASIGAIAVAPSNPDILYVGSGEGLQRPDLSVGDGIYKSIDGGKTWRHLGLRDGQQIPQIAVDPKDPNRLFVAVLGHPYGPNEERGIFRSLDGGETFQKVLSKNPDTGGVEVALDPQDPRIVYAALWESRDAPWENGHFTGPGSGLYKSIDGGTTWKTIGKGLPGAEQRLGRIGLGIAPSKPSRIFATVEAGEGLAGLYRSDDAGESFSRTTEDARVADRGDDFAEVKVDPRDPDTVFTASVVVWKSTDGGKTFAAFRGAPGGDDYQKLWLSPDQPGTMLIGSDQGVIITVNGGASFSSWYNQPTAQMFHVTADHAFPYRLCGGQQDSGSACVPSRGPDGMISFRDWHPAGVEEYGYAAPDPLDPDVVYGGKVSRWDRRTGQLTDVSPAPERPDGYRTVRTQPLLFSPLDPHTLYFASNQVWKTVNGGQSWTRISPDLTRKTWAPPAVLGKYKDSPEAASKQRGVIYALAPSPLDQQLIWAGTDDGLLHVTRDGGKGWQDVTPPQLGPWAKVAQLDASHFDKGTAYAAINTLRLDDLRPHALRTRDFGKTWTEVAQGLAGVVNVVREDPRRRGLLYAGTELGVFVSFDDGDHWQSLRQNLAATSIRDLVIKDADLAIATHGRGFWILDDLEPLRQLARGPGTVPRLLAPREAFRVRTNQNTDTPLPPDEPQAANPPDGAFLDYYLPAEVPVVLEVRDSAGALLRRFSSEDKAEKIADEGNVPRWWIRPGLPPSSAPGLHRFVWDLHYPAPAVTEHGFPIAAAPGDTPREPRGPWAVPGTYLVRLIAGGVVQSQPLVVKLDPRLKTAPAALRAQLALTQQLFAAQEKTEAALQEVRKRRAAQPKKTAPQAAGQVKPEPPDALAALEGEPLGRWGLTTVPPGLARVAALLAALAEAVQQADAAPTTQLTAAAQSALKDASALLQRYGKL